MESEQYIVKQLVGHQRNKMGNKKFLKSNENENTTYQNLQDTSKAVLRGKFKLCLSTPTKQKDLKKIAWKGTSNS
jgi:hypothetical protein